MCASGAPDAFVDFLISEGLVSIADFATSVTSEANVDTELIPEYEATLKDGAKAPFKVKAKVRQAWLAARKSISSTGPSSSSGPALLSDDYTLPDGTEGRLVANWVDMHHYNLPGTYLVSLKCLAKMYKGFKAQPRTMFVPVMSEIKLKSALPAAEVTGTMISGSSIYEVSSPVARAEVSLAEFFLLVRAWFTSWAYIAVKEGDWFDYETCIHFVESLYTFVFMRHDRRQPTIAGLTKAFLCTLSDFATEVQNHSVSLGSLVRNRSFWNHYWKDIEFQSSASSSAGAELATTQLPSDVQRSVNADERVTSALRSSLDRVNSSLQGFNPDGKGGGRRGRGRMANNQRGGNGNGNNGNNNANNNGNANNANGNNGNGGGNVRKVTDGGNANKQGKKKRFNR